MQHVNMHMKLLLAALLVLHSGGYPALASLAEHGSEAETYGPVASLDTRDANGFLVRTKARSPKRSSLAETHPTKSSDQMESGSAIEAPPKISLPTRAPARLRNAGAPVLPEASMTTESPDKSGNSSTVEAEDPSPPPSDRAGIGITIQTQSKTSKVATTEQDGHSEKLLEASGIKNQLQGVDAVVDKPQLEFLGLSPEEATIVSNAYSRTFHPDAYYADVLGTFVKGINRAHLATVSQWFLTPQGKKVVQLESISQTMSSFQREEKMMALLSSKFPTEERLNLVSRLEKAMGLTHLAVAQTQFQLHSVLPLTAELKKNGVETLLAASKDKGWGQPLYERALLSLFYAYHDLSDQDLAAFAGFAESAHGQWFFQLKNKALIDAQTRLGNIVTAQIDMLLKTIKSGRGDKKAIREVLPVGTRYLVAQSRDPFAPSPAKNESAKINFSRVLLENVRKTERRNAPRFSDELKVLHLIPLEIYKRLKEKKPALYDGLEKYGVLFKERTQLLAMKDAEYRSALEEYKHLIDKANNMSKEIIINTSLQIPYEALNPAGVVWKDKEPLALIETNDKLGYPARKGTLIGPEYGVVESIDRDKIVVVERKRDFAGTILSKRTQLDFNKTTKKNEAQP